MLAGVKMQQNYLSRDVLLLTDEPQISFLENCGGTTCSLLV